MWAGRRISSFTASQPAARRKSHGSIEKAISMGKTAIMLVPEISLTRRVIETFAGRFGKITWLCCIASLQAGKDMTSGAG
ncbi:MAG: hypothetical protein ACLTK0_04965 [Anaerovoracaceae bacterium]